MNSRASLTDQDPAALQRSAALAATIRAEIEAAPEACIGFDRYMALALYAPGLGYYTGGGEIFGPDGDFVTAPESGPLFAQCIARQLAPALAGQPARIVEYGAGSGALAHELITALENLLPGPPPAYHVVEPSAPLRARQREKLTASTAAISWHERHPPPAATGETVCVIANEVLDAMPARRFVRTASGMQELAVGLEDGQFCWRRRASDTIPGFLLESLADHPVGYVTEWIPGLAPWLADVAATMPAGIMLIADYGYPEHEYLHPSRSDGTLKAHFRHHVHGDPFAHPGAQDLTTSVNFTELARLAEAAGFDVVGYATQAHFLMHAGIDEVLQQRMTGEARSDYALAQEAKRLILPGEMGETCKVMALARNGASVPAAFSDDQRYRLAGLPT